MTMLEQARHCSFGLMGTFELYACARGNNGQNEKKLPLSKEERLSNKKGRLSNKKGRPASKEGTTAQPSGSGTQGWMNNPQACGNVTQSWGNAPQARGNNLQARGNAPQTRKSNLQASRSYPTSKGEQPHKQGGTTAQPNGECFLRKGKRHAHATSAYKCKLWPIRSCLVLRYL